MPKFDLRQARLLRHLCGPRDAGRHLPAMIGGGGEDETSCAGCPASV